MRKPTADEHDRVSAAVLAAEAGTSGEIVTIVAGRSDGYRDIALLYALLAAVFVPILFAAWPALPLGIIGYFTGGWGEAEVAYLMGVTLAGALLAVALALLALRHAPLRLAIVPRATRRQRVRTRAIDLFKVGAEGRTSGRTGILIYLSLGEHMAEIVADEAIHAKVAETGWGDAMIALVAHVREGRISDGMIAAVECVGVILATHLPRASNDSNELPDRLIEL